MKPVPPPRKSNAELAEEALAKARLYRARAREDERRAAVDFGLWVLELAASGDEEAVALRTRWEEQSAGKAAPRAAPKAAPKPVSRSVAKGSAKAAPAAEAPAPARPLRKASDDPARSIRAAQSWPVMGLELVSGQVRELVRQGRRMEARGLIVKAEESTGMPLVPAVHRGKWGLGPRAGEVVGPLR